MSRRQNLTGLVLRAKPYRETSLMVDIFTREAGRLTGVQKGYRNRKGQRAIQPFLIGHLVTSKGDGLVNIYEFETTENLAPREQVAAGFYVLELVYRALGERQVEQRVFDVVSSVLRSLEEAERPALRTLERCLLDDLGYGIDFQYAEDGSGESCEIEADNVYEFVAGQGFLRCDSGRGRDELSLTGQEIRDIAKEQYTSVKTAAQARRLYQSALTPLIGDKPLQSRRLLDPDNV